MDFHFSMVNIAFKIQKKWGGGEGGGNQNIPI